MESIFSKVADLKPVIGCFRFLKPCSYTYTALTYNIVLQSTLLMKLLDLTLCF